MAILPRCYEELMKLVRETGLLVATQRLLSWDQEAMMPPGGVEFRSHQLALLSRLVHERMTDPRVGELLAECEASDDLVADPASDSAANLRELRRTWDRETKLPVEIVSERARTRSVAAHEWAEARRSNDFERFRPWLEKSLAIARDVAAHYGWPDDGEPWDALAEGFEPGMTAAGIEQIFTPLRARLQVLLNDIAGASRRPPDAFSAVEVPEGRQHAFVRMVAERIGFDFMRGRLDTSAHPFCSGTHPGDVRMTTRFKPVDVGDALAATMHESGHGIYNQGLPAQYSMEPLGRAVSLGVHESQSRMWENQVGRSLGFWRWCQPQLAGYLGESVAGLTVDDVYGAVNRVEPGLIRVEADEATYNLHIMVRFDLERLLINGELGPADLPDAWNRLYADYLGVAVPDDARGCMQDIHWSSGSFGYFPTYTLGNLYAAQFFEKAAQDLGDPEEQFAQGEFGGLKTWLNENIHVHGSRFRPDDLCRRVTGRPLDADALMRHLDAKLRPLYGV